MATDSRNWRYRVVGIRTNRTQVTLARGLSMHGALSVLEAMSDTGAFTGLQIEPETQLEFSIVRPGEFSNLADEWDG